MVLHLTQSKSQSRQGFLDLPSHSHSFALLLVYTLLQPTEHSLAPGLCTYWFSLVTLFFPTHTWFRASPPSFRSLPHVQSPATLSLTTLCHFPAIFFSLALVTHFIVFTCFLYVLPTRSKLHECKVVLFSYYQL